MSRGHILAATSELKMQIAFLGHESKNFGNFLK